MYFHENDYLLVPISVIFVPIGPVDNILVLALVSALCQTGDKSFPKPILTQFTDQKSLPTATSLIDLIHKSPNAPVPYPIMPHSEQKCAHFCPDWSIVGYGTGAF